MGSTFRILSGVLGKGTRSGPPVLAEAFKTPTVEAQN